MDKKELDKKIAAYEKYASDMQASNMFLADIAFSTRKLLFLVSFPLHLVTIILLLKLLLS